MGPPLEVYLGAVLAAIPISGAVGIVALRNRSRPEARWLAVLSGGIVVWLTAIVAADAADSLLLSVLLVKGQYVGIVTTVAGFFLLALAFAGYEDRLGRRTLALVAVEPVFVLVAIVTNGVHRLFYETVEQSTTSVAGVNTVHGPLFWLHAVYSYVLLAVGVGLLLREIYRSSRIYRLQAAAVVVGTMAPWIGNFLYLSEVSPIDLSPVGFTITGAALLWAIYRYRLTDVAPIARNTLVDNIDDGVFVLDDEDRLVDVNSTGEEMLGVEADDVVGRPAREAFAEFPDLYDRYRDRMQATDEVELDTEYGIRHYEIRISPLEDDHGNRVGRLIVVHDVTERRRREQELQRQNEQLEEFASFLSHDLRNPLNVADGYLRTVRDTGDLSYLDEIERSHERIEQLIEEALTLAREGQTIDETDPVSLDDLAREAWGNVDTADATLTVETDATILADRPRALRILENCFRNAVEHGSTSPDSHARQDAAGTSSGEPSVADAPEDAVEHGSTSPDSHARQDAAEHGGTDVSVRVGAVGGDDPGKQGFYVADDGPGIPEDRRDAVVEMGMTTAEEGTGLGLAIVDSIAEAHGWRLEITDSDAGGARLEFLGVGRAGSAEDEPIREVSV